MQLPSSPAQWCTRCGAAEYPLQPCGPSGWRRPTVWLCPRCCGLLPGVQALPLPYVHPVFAPGEWVYVDPAIRCVHPGHPYAGRVVQVCAGTYYPMLEAYGERGHETIVPLCFYSEEWVYAEQEYVSHFVGRAPSALEM